MALSIRDVEVDINRATLSAQINRRSRGIVGRVVEALAKRKAQTTVQKYYKGAIQQVQRQLTAGIPGVRQSRGRVIAFNFPDGSVGRYTTQHWARLTQRYAAQPPTSTVFWRKHFAGGGARGSYRTLLGDYKAAISGRVSVSSGPVRVEDKQKKSYTILWNVTVSSLPQPLNMYITESLLAAVPVSRPLSSVNKRSIARIAYVEGRRPFISGMSAQMGRRMRVELLQLLT